MMPSDDNDLYRLDLALPPGMAALRVVVAETTTILAEIADPRFTVAARVHSLRKTTKRLRALFRLIRSGFPDYKEANATFRDMARLFTSHRDARVMAGLVENLGRSRTADPVVDWFDYRAEAAERLAAGKLQALPGPLQEALVRFDAWDFNSVSRDDVLHGFRKTFDVVVERSDLVNDESESEEAHEWRKLCKDHWYHLRLLQDALPAKERDKIEGYDRLGDLLGSVHDRDVLMHHLEALPEFLKETRQAAAIARAAWRERRAMQAEAVELSASLLDENAGKLASKIRRKWL
jgi:CHAD domain-containing protein